MIEGHLQFLKNSGYEWAQLKYTHFETHINIVKSRKYLSWGQEVILWVSQPEWSEINGCFEQHISWCYRMSTAYLAKSGNIQDFFTIHVMLSILSQSLRAENKMINN